MAAPMGQAFARLGDTEQQIAALYGNPVDNDKPDENGVITNTYHKGDYLILVQLLKGHSVAESYTRMDRARFSEKELSTFLKASAAGQEWNKQSGKKLSWERGDHRASAWCETLSGRPTLLIQARYHD